MLFFIREYCWIDFFLELGMEYCPPSQYLLPVLESDCSKQNTDCLDSLDEAWQVQYVADEQRQHFAGVIV